MRVLFLIVCSLFPAFLTAEETFSVERVPVAGGAELLTIFAARSIRPGEGLGDQKIPLLSILRDTLSSPQSERLRQVWVLTYAPPSIGQRLLAALPFYYSRSAGRGTRLDRPPAPILDLSQPQLVTWSQLLLAGVQREVLDGNGMFWRAPSRGYEENAAEYRNMQVAEALQLLSHEEARQSLPADEWDEVRARLILSRSLLGGLVSRSGLAGMSERQNRTIEMDRAHNWDLLRQQAESNGLYFQPLSFGEQMPGYALVWISRSDLEQGRPRPFNGAFLKIADPWSDGELRSWKGYEESWTGQRMIPLALYSLDYPPAPSLMADFRKPLKAKRNEMLARAADLAATGIFGFTGYANLGYAAGRMSFTWLRHRHGANTDRTSRVSAYAQLEHALFFDDKLDSKLRAELERRVDHLALNPFDRTQQNEIAIARKQYAALLKYARDPRGLPVSLERERAREMTPLVHGKTSQTLFATASVATLGFYTHRERYTPEMLARLERQRRLDADVRSLKKMLKGGPAMDLAKVLSDIEDLRPTPEELDSGVAQLLKQARAQAPSQAPRPVPAGAGSAQ